MWTIERSNFDTSLSAQASGAALFVADLGLSSSELIVVDYRADIDPLLVTTQWAAATTIATVTTGQGGTVTVPLDVPMVEVDAVTVGGIVYLPALNPGNPQVGEFGWVEAPDSSAGTEPIKIESITLNTGNSVVTPGQAVSLIGSVEQETVPTSYVSPQLIAPLRGLPVTGEISWSLKLEEHPSGSIAFLCNEEDVGKVRKRFRMWKKLSLFGLGFTVSSRKELIEPQQIKIDVSLSGAWASPEHNQPSRLLEKNSSFGSSGAGGSSLGRNKTNAKELDPECGKPKGATQSGTSTSGGKTISARSIESMASDVGVPFHGRVASSGGMKEVYAASWTRTVPADTDPDASEVWSSSAQDRARVSGGFLDWNSPSGVYIRDVNEVLQWRYQLTTMQISYQAGEQERDGSSGSDGNTGNTGGFQYVPVGDGSEDEDSDEGSLVPPPPRWVSRAPKKFKLRSGDPNVDQPPEEIFDIQDLSLNFDTSGPTKTQRTSTTVDGQVVEEEEVIYGFCYTGSDIISNGVLKNSQPSSFWKMVSYKRKTFLTDSDYGYSLGYNVSGFTRRRFRQESGDPPETVYLNRANPKDDALYDLYVFRKIPIREQNRLVYHAFETYYPDVEVSPAYVPYKHCNPDGTSSTRYILDPTWAPPMFMKDEQTKVRSFAKVLNPEFNPGQLYTNRNPAPPQYLITGEESNNRSSITLAPFNDNPFGFSSTNVAGEVYTQRTFEDSAQNAGFSDKATREQFTEYAGRPSTASRIPSRLEREEPESASGEPSNKKDPGVKQRSFVFSPAFGNGVYPVGGNISFTGARTMGDQMRGLTTDIKVRDIKNSASFDFEIPFNLKIRPGDLVTVRINGSQYSLRVSGVSNKIKISGLDENGTLILTSEPTKLSCGFERTWGIDQDQSSFPDRIVGSYSPTNSTDGGGGGGSGRGRNNNKNNPNKKEEAPPSTPSSAGLVIGDLNKDPFMFTTRGSY